MFLADPKLLGIIFQNLVSNAVKYTLVGGKISLNVKKEDNLLKISISDTGVGIPMKYQSKIFTKLFRADNILTIDPGGTGLGLYIVKEIVDNSGGTIWFESEEGKGTTFYVTFPMSGMVAKEGDKRII
jgi:two-component system phosphate regulon sensor histidine kinase PhoR